MPEIRAIEYAYGKLCLLDQTRLPLDEHTVELRLYREVIQAVKEMRVRGAPALGVVAAYGMAMAAREIDTNDRSGFLSQLEGAGKEIAQARPTAVNMAWAVERMLAVARAEGDMSQIRPRLLAQAKAIQEEDEELNRAIGGFGRELVPDGGSVLTHCNTGALATAGFGTALGVIRASWEEGKRFQVFHTETRPFLQGARLTAWELIQLGIPSTLIVDSAAGLLMREREIDCVIVGADRIAANGDTANKIGTYMLAALAKDNQIPFYVAAPISTVDMGLASGDEIPIEERPAEEVTGFGGVTTAPKGIAVRNPAFDITPQGYISAIVTDRGVLRPPYNEALLLATQGSASGRAHD